MRALSMLLLLTVVLTTACAQEVVVKRALRVEADARPNAMQNGDLELIQGEGLAGWKGWDRGYEVDREVRHGGEASARCTNATAEEHRGLTYVVALNQTVATPIVAECWSRAQDVGGTTADTLGDYALYLDLEYMDGTPLWGQIAGFKGGSHDWVKRAVTVIPSKPVRSVSVHGIFRRHTGTAWFDDFKLWELSYPEGTRQFDGVPISAETIAKPAARSAPGGTVGASLFVRDVAAGSDFIEMAGQPAAEADGEFVVAEGKSDALGLSLKAVYRSVGGALRVEGTITDLTGKDRAVTVYCSTSAGGPGWVWHDDQRLSRIMQAEQTYSNFTGVRAGAARAASRYPLACISNDDAAVAVGSPLDMPRLCRFACSPDSGELYGAVDLGLTADTIKFPSSASFSFVVYRCDPQWGFRSALQRYYELFPQCFTKRNQKEGIWMPFVDIANVGGWQDFGFQFQEGAPNVAFDERQGIYSFVYVEPMSHWVPMPKEMERTSERAMALVKDEAARGNRQFQGTINSVIEDSEGNWQGGITVAPWCDGALYLLNPSPYIREDDPQTATKFRNDLAAILQRAEFPTGIRAGWSNWERGYEVAPGEGRSGSVAARVTRKDGETDAGLKQYVSINQAEPRPLMTRVWTRGQDVTGEPDNNYSLYVDLVHTDGTSSWGHVVTGTMGTNEWKLLEQRIVPTKPVQSVAFHLLMRTPHTGTVWFDDAFLGEEGTDKNLLQNPDLEPGTVRQDVKPFLDGTYFDSFEMAAMDLNYRREQFRFAETPLVFDGEGRVCQMTVFNTVDYAREIAKRMHDSGRMTFANATPWNFAWGAAVLDVMGTETNWAADGKYAPEGDWIMNYRRAVCYQRPYLLLLNTVYDDFKPEWVELYMKRCTAYAVFPSMFSHNAADDVYWNSPNLYDRDRPLFKKYIPVISALSSAGWEPVTLARSDNSKVYVERYGKPGGPCYLTLFNDSNEVQPATVSLDRQALGVKPDVTVEEVLSGQRLDQSGGRISVTLQPEDVLVLAMPATTGF